MIATIPPRGHRADAVIRRLDADPEGALYEVEVGTAEFGNGSTTVHTQLAADALGTTPDRIRIRQSDTDIAGYDTGAYGSTGVVVAGKAVYEAARTLAADPALTEARGHSDGSQRTVAFNAHGFRVAVNPATGEVRILRSVQAADAGTVLNPEQLRGQIEGGTAQAIGSSLYEEVLVEDGHVTTSTLRNYRVPKFGDIPPTEVLFASTHDPLGPLGAKSMSEAPYNPVAPALANAIRDALGVRPYELPMSRDRVWRSSANPLAGNVRPTSGRASPRQSVAEAARYDRREPSVARRGSARRPLVTASTSARIDTAVCSGVVAPRSSPIGACSRESSIPRCARAARRFSVVRREPIAPT